MPKKRGRKKKVVSFLEIAYEEVITTCAMSGQNTFSSHYKHPDRNRKKETPLITAFLDTISMARGGDEIDSDLEAEQDSDEENY